jgi:hypothetical protein
MREGFGILNPKPGLQSKSNLDALGLERRIGWGYASLFS